MSMIPTPHCTNMSEHPDAAALRIRLNASLLSYYSSNLYAPLSSSSLLPLSEFATSFVDLSDINPRLTSHLLHGLAYTTGSALGCTPPTAEECRAAFEIPNSAGLSAGARAWSKHAHRSGGSTPSADATTSERAKDASGPPVSKEQPKIANVKTKKTKNEGWWGVPAGSVALLNARAFALLERVLAGATWRNLHWLPRGILVYETRVSEGYGMRWSRDLGGLLNSDGTGVRDECVEEATERPWTFRGFVEPMMEGGHEVGWRH
jgi:hypothetical protein